MRKIIIILLMCVASKVWGNKISDAYSALSLFDYFKARQLFYKSLSKYPAESSFGLATIFYRNDNPFSNIDSAAKYISICKTQFKDTVTYSLYHINNETINSLTQQISNKGFNIYCKNQSVNNLNYYLSHFYFANDSLLSKSYISRDELQLDHTITSKSSDSVNQFLLNYPQSSLYWKAKQLFYNFQYAEKVPKKTWHELQIFIKQYSNNPNITDAENNLFKLTKQSHSADSLYNFIKHYSTNQTKEAAWKLLYSISVKNYSKEQLTNFLNKYPDYPYNETVIKEISLSQNILIPLKNLNDKFGFIDTLGNWVISPQFDDASIFSEGFASVCKNDSCFYINKEGHKTSANYFEETENYTEGIAIIKKEGLYYLINRSGQIITKGYQDINEPSEKLYVCKLNATYGAINTKGEIVIPFSYTKLGNFKNNFAYYLSSQYGLVDIHNKTLQAQWDWISDVDTNSNAIVKKKDKFGILNVKGQLILPPEYDYLTHCQNEIYLVVKNNLYGFYNSQEKCFVTSVEYNYNSTFKPSYYTNGKQFKLLKDNEVALVDANGRYSINFGTYSNLFFAKCDIIRIQKNNKYGFVDRKLKSITLIEYDKATDYENNIAIASKGSSSFLIDKAGKIIYTIKNGEIMNEENSLFIVKQNELIGLVNSEGKSLLNIEFESINLIKDQLYVCMKNNELYIFNLRTKILKKI
jgi:hypothetical protein